MNVAYVDHLRRYYYFTKFKYKKLFRTNKNYNKFTKENFQLFTKFLLLGSYF